MKIVQPYARVSTQRQVKEGESVQAQDNRLQSFWKGKENHVVLKTALEEGKSASIDQDKIDFNYSNGKFKVIFDISRRPELCKILEKIGSDKIDILSPQKWDRIGRDPAFVALLQRYLKTEEIEIIPSDDPTDPFASDIIQAVSKYEIEKMKSRVKLVRQERFNNGIMPGRSPVGYRLPEGHKKFVLDEPKAKMVQDIFNMTLNGSAYKEICEKYKLNPQSYYNIISNKVYIGLIEFDGVEKEGIHPKIISKEIFDKVQELMRSRNGKI